MRFHSARYNIFLIIMQEDRQLFTDVSQAERMWDMNRGDGKVLYIWAREVGEEDGTVRCMGYLEVVWR